MGHPEQLISRVVVVVKDLQLQPEVLFMWANLGNNFELLKIAFQIEYKYLGKRDINAALDSTMAATGVAAVLSSSPRSHPAKQWGTSRGALPSCARVHLVACISTICDYECVTPTGNTHDHAGPCFITNVEKKRHFSQKIDNVSILTSLVM